MQLSSDSSGKITSPKSAEVKPWLNINLILGAACISLQPILLSMVALPATAYVIRRMGPNAYGQWVTATTIVATISFITNLGLRGTFVRSVARCREGAADALADQIGIRLTLSILASFAALTACIALGYPMVVLVCTAISCASLLLTAAFTTASDLLQGFHQFTSVAVVNMVSGVLLTAASVVVVYCGAGPIGVAACYLIGPAVGAILMMILISRQHFAVRVRWSFRRFKPLLWQARYIGVQQLVSSANNNIEALLIPRLLGATPFGFFAAGTLLPTRLTAIPDGIGTAAYPIIARKHVINGRSAVIYTLYFLALVLVPCLIAAVGGSLLARPISALLFPGRALLCEQVMRITVWLLPLMGVQCVLGYALNAVHADAAQAKASAVGSVLSLILAAFLVWRFGLIGASWSMIARYAMQLLALSPCVVRIGLRSWNEPSRDEPTVNSNITMLVTS